MSRRRLSQQQRDDYRRNNRVIRILQPEYKHLDTRLSSVGVGPVSPYYNLALMQRGSGDSERIGDKITATSLLVRARLTNLSNTPHTIRILVFMDLQTNGQQAPLSDILEDTGNAYRTITPRNLDNSHRFIILAEGKSATIPPLPEYIMA